MLTYKVIELGTVTEEAIEETLNEWTANGWNLNGMQFAMRESSRRPSMCSVPLAFFEKTHSVSTRASEDSQRPA